MSISPLTFVFEIVNFLVLLYLLQRLVFRPLKRSIDERRAEERRMSEDAKAKVLATEELGRRLEEERRSLALVRERVVREAAEQGDEERSRILASAREDAAAEQARALKLVQAERRAAEEWVREATVDRATETAGRMLLALAPDAVEGALRERLLTEIERRGRALSTGDVGDRIEVEVRCAKLPEDADLERIRASLGQVLGRTPHLVVREDEALLAGIVVRVGDTVLDASVAGQLDILREQARAILAEGRDG
jgi:F0F1-type ATP synthase membrane subunit b/b'